jgi:hypothetical protein
VVGQRFFENSDLLLNFWFWLNGSGAIFRDELVQGVGAWAKEGTTPDKMSAMQHDPRWAEYVEVGKAWKAREVERFHDEVRRKGSAKEAAAQHRALSKIGVQLHVEWVMAPFGERWLFNPDLAILGAEGGSGQGRRTAVLDAARALGTGG